MSHQIPSSLNSPTDAVSPNTASILERARARIHSRTGGGAKDELPELEELASSPLSAAMSPGEFSKLTDAFRRASLRTPMLGPAPKPPGKSRTNLYVVTTRPPPSHIPIPPKITDKQNSTVSTVSKDEYSASPYKRGGLKSKKLAKKQGDGESPTDEKSTAAASKNAEEMNQLLQKIDKIASDAAMVVYAKRDVGTAENLEGIFVPRGRTFEMEDNDLAYYKKIEVLQDSGICTVTTSHSSVRQLLQNTEKRAYQLLQRSRYAHLTENVHFQGIADLYPFLEDRPWRNVRPSEAAIALAKSYALPFEYLDNIQDPEYPLINDGDRTAYVLSFHLESIRLAQHPLSTEEIRLAVDLDEAVSGWRAMAKQNELAHHLNRIKALRKKLYDLQNLTAPDAELALQEVEERVQALEEVTQRRAAVDAILLDEQLTEFSIVKLFDQIKTVRDSQGFSSSSIELETSFSRGIPKGLDGDHMEGDWTTDASLDEQRTLIEFENLKRKLQAEQAHNKWEKQCLLANNQRKPPQEPMPPVLLEFNETSTLRKIEKKVRNLRNRFEKGRLYFNIRHSHQITDTAHLPRRELMRRELAKSTKIYAKIFYNKKEVGRSMTGTLDSHDLTMKFGSGFTDAPRRTGFLTQFTKAPTLTRIMNIQSEGECRFDVAVCEVPASISIELWEVGFYNDELVGELFVPIPGSGKHNVDFDRPTLQIKFVGRPYVEEMFDEKAGNEALVKSTELWTSGTMGLQVRWKELPNGKSLGPSSLILPMRFINDNGHMEYEFFRGAAARHLDLQKWSRWMSKSSADPNSPLQHGTRGSPTLLISPFLAGKYEEDNKKFRVTPPFWMMSAVAGVGLANSFSGKRIRALSIRVQSNQAYPIGLTDMDILESQLEEVKPDKADIIPKERQKDLRFLKKLQLNKQIQKRYAERPILMSTFVREEKLEFSSEPSAFGLEILYSFIRPLNPPRIGNFLPLGVEDTDSCKIIVHVQRGKNFPLRRANSKIQDAAATTPRTLRSYVEVSFQHHRARTEIAEGAAPFWGENLEIDISMLKGLLNSENIFDTELGSENVYLNVYDEYLVDLTLDNRDRISKIHQRRERNWIGRIVIPFISLFQKSRLEGAFHLKTPFSSLLYKRESKSEASDHIAIDIDPPAESYLYLFMALEPAISLPETVQEMSVTPLDKEEERLKQRYMVWSLRIPMGKYVAVFSQTLQGEEVFVCRYISKQEPPPNIASLEQICRYVAMIPCIPSSSLIPGISSIWATSSEMLELGAGDSIEHAMLLCNYLLYQGRKAYVALGSTLCDPKASFVLLLENTNQPSEKKGDKKVKTTPIILIDPVTGDLYHNEDMHCPILSIDSVFGSDNIYVNIQSSTKAKLSLPINISYDFKNPSKWRAFFDNAFKAPPIIKALNQESLYYQDCKIDLKILEEEIESKIMASVEDWRNYQITRWNRLCSKTLSKMLSSLEGAVLAGQDVGSVIDSSRDLSKLNSTYTVSGSPINVPYTDIPNIISHVQSTDMHSNSFEGVEFALGLHCFSYPGGFISVWIFLATLMRKH